MLLRISHAGKWDNQFQILIFELFDTKGFSEVLEANDLAKSGRNTRDEYIVKQAESEHKTQLQVKCYNALAECALPLVTKPRLGVLVDFRLYMSRFEKDAKPHMVFSMQSSTVRGQNTGFDKPPRL